jgi:hypothetical protein
MIKKKSKIKKKYIRAVFECGACYILPVDKMTGLYAKTIIMQRENISLECAVLVAAEHLKNNIDELIQFISYCLCWKDVVHHAVTIKSVIGNKDDEWQSAKKELVDLTPPSNPLANGGVLPVARFEKKR